MDNTELQRKGDYEVLGALGAGGMGKVYKVRNVISDRIEAMKVLLPDLADQQELASRFLREIKVLASLNHPNIAMLRTALMIDNQLIMIMEYVEGTTLAARLKQGKIPCSDALNYIDQVLAALSYAHKQNVVHRDIKPANMMVMPNGMVKLMDFGIARSGNDLGLTMAGTTLGSLHYMSPEQVKGENIDARSDLYSVGVSLYEMVTAQKPFTGDSRHALMQAQLQQAPRPPNEVQGDLPDSLNQIILMAMAKEPARRFQSADAFREALKSVDAKASRFTATATTLDFSIPPTSPAKATTSESRSGTIGPISLETKQPANVRIKEITATPAPRPVSPSVVASAAPMPPPAPVSPSVVASAQPVPPPALVSSTAAVPPRPMPPPETGASSHRGLYITLGAAIVLVVAVAAGLSLPSWFKTGAHGKGASQPKVSEPAQPAIDATGTQTVAPAPATSGGANAVVTTGPPVNPAADQTTAPDAASLPPSAAKPMHIKNKTSQPSSSPERVSAQQAESRPTTEPPPTARTQPERLQADPAQLAELDHEMDQISARVAAANASLDSLQRAQGAQGLGLRGDILAAQQRMQAYAGKGQAALQAQDIQNTKKYLDLTETELQKIEKFLGH